MTSSIDTTDIIFKFIVIKLNSKVFFDMILIVPTDAIEYC